MYINNYYKQISKLVVENGCKNGWISNFLILSVFTSVSNGWSKTDHCNHSSVSVIRIRFASVFTSVRGGYNAPFFASVFTDRFYVRRGVVTMLRFCIRLTVRKNGPFFHPLRATKGKTDTDDGYGCIVTIVLDKRDRFKKSK